MTLQHTRGFCHWPRLRPVTLAVSMLPTLPGCLAPPVETKHALHFEQAPRRPALPAVSVLVPPDERLLPLLGQLRDELQEDFDVLVTSIDRSARAAAAIGRAMRKQRPQAVVLVNNTTVRAYRRWAKSAASPPVAIVLMSSFADQLQPTVPNSVGIAYEVPAVTSLVGLRALGKSVRRTGVVHRRALTGYVSAQAALAKAEGIEFVTEVLDAPLDVRQLKAALVRLRRARVDVLWLPNDNALLTRQLVTRAWLPYLGRLELPVVVGVPSLVSSHADFGIFAAIPDLEPLALQAADLLFQLRDADWAVTGERVQLPLSTRTYVSAAQGRRHGLTPGYSERVDVVVGAEEGTP